MRKKVNKGDEIPSDVDAVKERPGDIQVWLGRLSAKVDELDSTVKRLADRLGLVSTIPVTTDNEISGILKGDSVAPMIQYGRTNAKAFETKKNDGASPIVRYLRTVADDIDIIDARCNRVLSRLQL